METEERNFPAPKNAADRIVLKASELLDRDVLDAISNVAVRVRGVYITRPDRNTRASVALRESPCDDLKLIASSPEYSSRFGEAVDGYLGRERERRAAPLERSINAEPDQQPPGLVERVMLWLTNETGERSANT